MGAYLDHGGWGRLLPGWRKVQRKRFGATGIAADAWCLKGRLLDDRRKTWSVCPHLSSMEGLFDYYMASGRIMVLLGKCFCHECYEMILAKRDLQEFMDSCQHLTDKMLQKNFIDPLLQINSQVFNSRRNFTGEDKSRWAWIACSHISKIEQLEKLYTSCNPIFFHEGFVTCNDCSDVVPSASLYMQTLMECEAMTDDQLQDRLIDRLYPINREILEAVGRYRR